MMLIDKEEINIEYFSYTILIHYIKITKFFQREFIIFCRLVYFSKTNCHFTFLNTTEEYIIVYFH